MSWDSMVLNFTKIPVLLLNGQQPPYVLVTEAFPHIAPTHLVGNIIGLYLCIINIPLPSRLGALKFVSLFLGSAIGGGLVQLALSIDCFNRMQDSSCLALACKSLGASGGISGLIITAILWRPKSVLVLPIHFLMLMGYRHGFTLPLLWDRTTNTNEMVSKIHRCSGVGVCHWRWAYCTCFLI